jgi:hypothetical protein
MQRESRHLIKRTPKWRHQQHFLCIFFAASFGTMKLSTTFATLALLHVVPAMVQADRLVRVLLNDGKNDTGSGSCNDINDDDLINRIIFASGLNSTYTRNLRSSSYVERYMQYYPPKCKRVCEGFATGSCRATDCVGYRRNLAETSDVSRDLVSGKSFSCDAQIYYIDTELDNLADNNLVTPICKKLLSKHRKWDCYDDVIYGVVERMVLWQVSPTQTVLDSQYSGQNICINNRFDFEPVTNSCVDVLVSTVTGPNDFYKNSTISNSNGVSVIKTVFGSESGVLFPTVGAYTIETVPDGFQNKALTIPFSVVSGEVEVVRLWNITTKTIIDSNFTGGFICRSKKFNLEVVVGGCATKFRATLTGPGYSKSTTSSNRPFSMFGGSTGNFKEGSLSTAGLYNFTIYPDQIVSPDVKSILFQVVTC